MPLKLKNNEVAIKGIGCTDEKKQWNWIYKEDILLLTVSTEGLILSCMIDTMELRYVATSDITRAFLQTYYEKVDRWREQW